MQHPLCKICLKLGITKPAEDVHHKDSFTNYSGNMKYSKAYDWSNLIALCKFTQKGDYLWLRFGLGG